MTLQELIAYPKATVSPKQVASITGQDPYWYNLAARQGFELPFRFFWSGRNLRICKADVLAFCGLAPDGTVLKGGAQDA